MEPEMTSAVKVKNPWRWAWLTAKILFFVLAFFAVIFTVMANIGGKSDVLKQSIEEFISENTPYKAAVGTLNGMTFFPSIAFDFENASLYDKKSQEISISIKKVQVAFSFWDVMAANGRIKALNIADIEAKKDTLLKPEFSIESLKISDSAEGAVFEGMGKINGEPVEFSVDMDSLGSGHGKRYFFGPERKFYFRLGDIEAHGLLKAGKNAGVVAENLEVLVNKQKIMNGTLSLVRNGDILNVGGALEMAAHGSHISPALDIGLPGIKEMKVSGIITADPFQPADFSAGSDYDRFVSMIENIFEVDPAASTPELTLDAGSLQGPVPMNGWHVETQKLEKSQ